MTNVEKIMFVPYTCDLLYTSAYTVVSAGRGKGVNLGWGGALRKICMR